MDVVCVSVIFSIDISKRVTRIIEITTISIKPGYLAHNVENDVYRGWS